MIYDFCSLWFPKNIFLQRKSFECFFFPSLYRPAWKNVCVEARPAWGSRHQQFFCVKEFWTNKFSDLKVVVWPHRTISYLVMWLRDWTILFIDKKKTLTFINFCWKTQCCRIPLKISQFRCHSMSKPQTFFDRFRCLANTANCPTSFRKNISTLEKVFL